MHPFYISNICRKSISTAFSFLENKFLYGLYTSCSLQLSNLSDCANFCGKRFSRIFFLKIFLHGILDIIQKNMAMIFVTADVSSYTS